jgi:hypothetical protein
MITRTKPAVTAARLRRARTLVNEYSTGADYTWEGMAPSYCVRIWMLTTPQQKRIKFRSGIRVSEGSRETLRQFRQRPCDTWRRHT